MCGIAGFHSHQMPEQTAAERLSEMLQRIVHRGPDDRGELVRPADGLFAGMRRLSVIDLARGRQPIWNEDETVAVLFNGEVYNYRELRDELSGREHQFRTDSDTEVLVHLYEEDRLQMFHRLRGMFAICLMDFRDRQLVLARDHFGQKPLYYHQSSGLFAWASELKSLLALPEISTDEDEFAFAEYVRWLKVGPGRTHFRDIRKLQPAHYLTCDLATGQVSVPQRYWRYPPAPQAPIAEEAAIRELDRLLDESTRLHLRMDVPMGLLLSGGLDSRTIAFYAKRHFDRNVRTYTIGYDAEDSELEDAAQTANEIGSSGHTAVIVTPEMFRESLSDVAWHLDEPVGDPAAFAVRSLCLKAREDVTVLLGGEGADELFCGYYGAYHGGRDALQRRDVYRRLTLGLAPAPRRFPRTKSGRLLYSAGLTRGEQIAALRQLGFPGDIRHPRGLTETQLNRSVDHYHRIAGELYHPNADSLLELTGFDIEWHLAESLLQKADKMSMAASIELRCPFLDVEIAEFAGRLPAHLKLTGNGIGKYILRKTLSSFFEEDMSRPKKGFPIPLKSWFRGPLREMMEDIVLPESAQNRRYLDGGLLRAAWQDFLQDRWDGEYLLYSLLLYEIWYQRTVRVRFSA